MYDQIFPKLMFAFLLLEFFADQQQWDFHGAKDLYAKTAKVPSKYSFTRAQLDRGFNTAGLWAWSRHPNFLGEQAFWLTLYQWCCCESYTWMNWTFSAAFAYLCLFQASTWLTEMLSDQKYPEYRLYQERVGKFLPKFSTKSMEEPYNPREEEKVHKAQEAKDNGEDPVVNLVNGAKEKVASVRKGKKGKK
jgi:steroid 5-alpha reductase family enzyme